MKSKHVTIIVTFGIVLLTLLFPTQGEARLWQFGFGSGHYFAVDQVCRDGMAIVNAYYMEGDDPQLGDTVNATITIRLSENPALPEINTPGYPTEVYGPLLISPTDILMTYHAEPLIANINDSTIIDFYVYNEQIVVWSQVLDVGESVLVYSNPFVNDVVPVEDCYFNQLVLDQSGMTTIDDSYLFVSDGLIDDNDMVYELDSIPSNGSLYLNNTPLEIDDLFTQDDVNNHRLTYRHDGSATTSDSFVFRARATTRVSVNSNGTPGNDNSINPDIGIDGKWITFQSRATNLVTDDTNNVDDIFVHNQVNNVTTRESVSTDETQANGGSFHPVLAVGYAQSGSVEYVAFESRATNLTDAVNDCSGAGADQQVFRREIGIQTMHYSRSDFSILCETANSNSFAPAIAEDGRTVVFDTSATNLLPAQDQDAARDVYQVDYQDVSLVSVATDSDMSANGTSYNAAISDNGDHVAFASTATNLISNDTNGFIDIFVRTNDQHTRISVTTDNLQANGTSYAPAISFDGRYVAFASIANNLVIGDTNKRQDIFIRDRDTDVDGIFDEPGSVSTTRVSLSSDGIQANGSSFAPSISAHGRYIAFESLATNLVDDDTNGVRDIFLHDRETGQTTRVSVAGDGTQANASSSDAVISSHGHYIVFESSATNLVMDDTNAKTDVFVHYWIQPFTFAIESNRNIYLPLITE